MVFFKFKSTVTALLLTTASAFSAGCGKQLDAAIAQANAAGNASTTALTASYRHTLTIADAGWKQSFAARRDAENVNFVMGLSANGYRKNPDGSIEGQIEAGWIMDAIDKRDEVLARIAADEARWNNQRRDILALIDDFEKTMDQSYDNIEDAYRAKAERRALEQDILQALSAAAGGILGSIAVGGL
ncbi:MAG TPA: hypothetical protein VNT79_15420 [Phycisphaerae bacterium]|nr:hypothetical protein [Phycisphaerae bacterium]